MAIRSTKNARPSIVAQSLADLPKIKAGLLPQGNKSEAPKASVAPSLASPIAPKVQEYRAPLQSAVTLLLTADFDASKGLWDACASFCLESGPISETAWLADIEPLFATAAKKVKCDAKRKSEFKVFLIGYSNGLRPKGAANFTSYVRLVRKEAGYDLLVAPSNRGAKTRNDAPKAPKAGTETPKGDGKGLIASEMAASGQTGRTSLDHALALIGTQEMASFLVRACETGNRDQLVKYLKITFPAPKAETPKA
jgi:hypothetical protein